MSSSEVSSKSMKLGSKDRCWGYKERVVGDNTNKVHEKIREQGLNRAVLCQR